MKPKFSYTIKPLTFAGKAAANAYERIPPYECPNMIQFDHSVRKYCIT